jgi:hypothetical protein
MNVNSLRQIFHEAQVIDLDFSVWDHYIRIVVITTSMPLDRHGNVQVLNIDFVDCRRIDWSWNKRCAARDKLRHIQWNIIEFDLQKTRGWAHIVLADAGSSSPELRIECRDVRVKAIDCGWW